MRSIIRLSTLGALCALMQAVPTAAQTARPPMPVRDAHAPGYVAAKDLPDGETPPPSVDGNFVLGPTHPPVPAPATVFEHGRVLSFTMQSADSRFYPGIVRDPPQPRGTPDPDNPARLLVPNSHPGPWTRTVWVYVPSSYKPAAKAPFIVAQDGPDPLLFAALDAEIAAGKLPAIIGVAVQNGGGDAQGSERGLEYDTLSGRYAEFVESEILPRVEAEAGVRLTKDPDGRAATGGSSGAACAFIMAWYHPELYHRVILYSGTFTNQQWPYDPKSPHGAWEFPEHLLAETPPKPIRVWMEVSDRDLLNPNPLRDGMHDWVEANERVARQLAARGYHYQFVFARNAGHTERSVKAQTIAEALEYVWAGYKPGDR